MIAARHRVTLALTAFAFATSALVYPWLPDRVPIHFDIRGHADGFASRLVGAFLVPIVLLVMTIVEKVRRAANSAMRRSTVLVSAFLLLVHVFMLRAALTQGSFGDGFWLVTGVFFVAIGLVLPRVPRNLFVGVRTPWSLRSPDVWARSQRVGGYALVAGGIGLSFSSAMSGQAAIAMRAISIFGAAIVSIGYSYVAAKTSET
jgi:uncharacterized membrane protein